MIYLYQATDNARGGRTLPQAYWRLIILIPGLQYLPYSGGTICQRPASLTLKALSGVREIVMVGELSRNPRKVIACVGSSTDLSG